MTWCSTWIFGLVDVLRNNIIDMDDVKAISKKFGHLDISMDGHWVSLLMMAEVCEVYICGLQPTEDLLTYVYWIVKVKYPACGGFL